MNKYKQLKDRQQKELNEFPMFFAFNQQQFNEGMIKLSLQPHETDQIIPIWNTGGYIRKSEGTNFAQMMKKFEVEKQNEIDADTTGENYIFDMFQYELDDHEFVLTMDIEPTLNALGLSLDDVTDNPNLRHGLNKAIRAVRKYYNENN